MGVGGGGGGGGGGGQCPSLNKSVGAFVPMAAMLLHHYTYNTQSSYMCEKYISDMEAFQHDHLEETMGMNIQFHYSFSIRSLVSLLFTPPSPLIPIYHQPSRIENVFITCNIIK